MPAHSPGDSSINQIVWSNLTQALLTYESLTFQHPSPIQTLCPRTVIWLMVLVGYMVVFLMSMPSLLAFLDVSSAQNPALSHGASGLLGLGFDSLSTIGALVNAIGASTGRSLLYHLFQDNPSEPNFIALSLRSTSDNDQVTGSFAIGETEPQYSNVTSTNKIQLGR
ncbi:hypothetical protein BD769DRAFT_1665006 [Suillus cothurnatus]|nr:hypothetical protein BD769DRAFT_1665006 [Suillus cothurnatus]